LSEEDAAVWMGVGKRGGKGEGERENGSGGGEWGLFLKGLEAKGWDTTSRVLLAADAWRAEWGMGLVDDVNNKSV
jgi:hypothetical protein